MTTKMAKKAIIAFAMGKNSRTAADNPSAALVDENNGIPLKISPSAVCDTPADTPKLRAI